MAKLPLAVTSIALAVSFATGIQAAHAQAYAVPSRLAHADTITYCMAVDNPPLSYYDSSNQPTGLAVDIAKQVAAKIGNKKVVWKALPFAGLIPALMAQQCDMIVAQLFDKPERRQVIDMVDYSYSSESVLVRPDFSKPLKSLADLSGEKVATSSGSTARGLVDAENKALIAAGKPAISMVIYSSETDSLQALMASQADAFATTTELAGFYQGQHPGQFKTALPAFHRILTGFGISKQDSALTQTVQRVIDEMRKDGSYEKLATKYNIRADALGSAESGTAQ